MILEPISSLKNHAAVIPRWDIVHQFLQRSDLQDLPDGIVEIDGNAVFAIVATCTPSDVVAPLEVHQKYLDVQLVISGSFDIFWKGLEFCTKKNMNYDADKDCAFYSDTPQSKIVVEPGVAVVFFPHDAHAPQPPAKHVKKIVIKVALG